MSYVKCHDCGSMVHFKPFDIVEFNKRFIDNKEPIYCLSCFKKREEKANS